MHILLISVHVLAAVLLVVVILIQRGRGGGLVESFSSMESMFGTKTNQFLSRTTAVFAIIFLITSISLALFSAHQSRSLINDKNIPITDEVMTQEEGQPVEPELPQAPEEDKTTLPEEEGIKD